MSSDDWMRALSDHYLRVRRRHPDQELCVAFDIDGTILDMRHLVVHVLLRYDRVHGSDLFRGLVADDIRHHEDDVEAVLSSLRVPAVRRAGIAAFYRASLWDPESLLAASLPFEGVLGVIRWFQLQPGTHVALNTGRPERMREPTLASLEQVGAAYRVHFSEDLLFMAAPGCPVPQAKADALAEIRRRGFRTVAVVDNEPENLRAMRAEAPDGEVLFLHADTIFASERDRTDGAISGATYRLDALVSERTLPGRVEFVWHGVNDVVNLERFCSSEMRWAEIDVRRDPLGRLILRHDGFEETPWRREEPMLFAAEAVGALASAGRGVKLDLKEGGGTLSEALDLVGSVGLRQEDLWFNAELPVLGPSGFQHLRRSFPASTISCPVDAVVPLILASDDAADQALGLLEAWGISRLSLRWGPAAREILALLESRGWQVNLYDIPDLEAFLHASLLLPASVTADFNFPAWGYFGRGSGAHGQVHRYERDRVADLSAPLA